MRPSGVATEKTAPPPPLPPTPPTPRWSIVVYRTRNDTFNSRATRTQYNQRWVHKRRVAAETRPLFKHKRVSINERATFFHLPPPLMTSLFCYLTHISLCVCSALYNVNAELIRLASLLSWGGEGKWRRRWTHVPLALRWQSREAIITCFVSELENRVSLPAAAQPPATVMSHD